MLRAFGDPYRVKTSLQLSTKLAAGDSFQFLDVIRQADLFFTERKFEYGFQVLEPLLSYFKKSDRRKIKKSIRYNFNFMVAYSPVIQRLQFIKECLHEPGQGFTGPELKKLIRHKRRIFNSLYGKDISISNVSYRETYASIGVKDLKSDETFLHLDEKKGLTTIVYLSETNEDNGAFRYLKNSEAIPFSLTLKSFQETVHAATREKRINPNDLPPEIRMTLNIFNDLEHEKQSIILQNLVWVNGGPGTAITFCGNRLLHGGGKPVQGVRTSMFITHKGLFFQRTTPFLSL